MNVRAVYGLTGDPSSEAMKAKDALNISEALRSLNAAAEER